MVVQKSIAERPERQNETARNGTGTRRTQAERRLVAKDGLLDATTELFAEHGVAETSLGQIGERAGYSRGLASHHFGSKAELIECLAERVQTSFTDSLKFSSSDNALEAILRIVRAYVGHSEVLSSESRALLVMWGASFPRDSSVTGIAEADTRARATLATWVERGQTDGSISAEVQPAAAAAVLLGMLRGVVAQCLVDPNAFDLAAVLAECERMVRAGLAPSTPPTATPRALTKTNKTQKNKNTKES